MSFRQTHVSGLPAIALRSAELEVVVVPVAGGKVTNLRRLTGREWLWRSPSIPLRPYLRGTPYLDRGDSGGWDECFPTIAPCTVTLPGGRTVALDDHGELWTAHVASAVYEAQGEPILDSSVAGAAFPFQFSRRIRLERNQPVVHFEYQVRNVGADPFPWIWAAHPLLTIQPGTRIELPTATRLRVGRAFGRTDLAPDQELTWPDDLLPGGVLDGRRGWAVKAFGDLGPSGRMIVVDPHRGERLEIEVDPSLVPQVGVWLNLEGWALPGTHPHFVAALEPCIGAPGSLARAIDDWKTAQTLNPGEVRTWAVRVRLPEP